MAGLRRATAYVLLGLVLAQSAFALAQAPTPAEEGPLAYFTVTPDPAASGRDIRADARDSRPGPTATRIIEYAWRFEPEDDFTPGNSSITHLYARGGVQHVALRVTDDAGGVATFERPLLVKGAAPTAEMFLVTQERDGGILVIGNATFSAPSRGATTIVTLEWDWGEGEGFVPGNVTEEHFYAKPGAYRVTLRVTDDQDRTATETEPVVFRSTFLQRMGRVWEQRDAFFEGAKLTLFLAVIATILGFTLAILLALMRVSRKAILSWPAAAYVEFIRGTPLLVQILVAWLVLPFIGVKLPILWAGLVALVINTSAYQAEAIRGGIQAIPSGQMEAATSLGMTHLQAMRYVILPQAFRLTLPPLGNEFIILLKDTSLVSVIGVVELTKVGQIFSAQTFLVLETWLGVALVYFVMTFSLSLSLRRLEKRLAIPGLGVPTAGGH